MTTTTAALDMTGAWRVLHHVTSSDRSEFVGLEIEFQITLSQDGGQLGGGGEKFLVDQKPADRNEVSQLEITGWVHPNEVRIALMERARQGRTLFGEIWWEPDGADHMVGTFRVDLAHTSGRSSATRVRGRGGG